MAHDITVKTAAAQSAAVGAAHGVTPAELREIAPAIADGHKRLAIARESRQLGFFDLYEDRKMHQECASLAKRMLGNGVRNLVILGIGGSALGTRALATALLHPYHNSLTDEELRGHPRLFVMDNVDPDTFSAMLEVCAPRETLYNVISKSGGTAETLGQLHVVLDRLADEVGPSELKNHIVVTTGLAGKGKQPNALEDVAFRRGLSTLPIPDNVGGRFSVFTPVGLFPAAMLGIDIGALANGCQAMAKRCATADLNRNPAYRLAAFYYLLERNHGKSQCVLMPYADTLRDVSDWFRQLWAESLGKQFSRGGDEIFAGQTPINALGAVDQHSQIQLYREGPNDKLITILGLKRFVTTLNMPKARPAIKGTNYLADRTMNQLMAAQMEGTAEALTESERPVIRIDMKRLTSSSVAELLYMFEVQTAMAGELYDVNAFDQPAVERGKVIARQRMKDLK